MAKHPGDIPKFQRLDEIKKIFERHGVLDKAAVTQKIALRFDIEEKNIKRVLYRDLEELVNLGFLREEFLSPDGAVIHDFDPSVHKNYKKNWYVPGYENQVTGSGSLENYGGKLICHKILKNDFNLASNTLRTTVRRRHLFFISSGMYFSLDIDLEAMPVNIIVLRKPDSGEFTIHEEHIERFGIRTASLFLPSPMLSGYKSERPGHFRIELLDEGKILISDLGSKNGTFQYKLSHKEADLIREKGLNIGEETMTEDWNQMLKSALERESISAKVIEAPLIIEGSSDSRVLII